ncbi:carbohydrate kinase family protein [Leifsonia sp. YAF41]|uniref:carbohydrate kinase family protein n=1 Tax=Leifsonia sp. YAF41 TaxID=3233086 RepID=UPI003F96B1EB
MNGATSVCVLGDLNVDLGLDIPAFPPPGGDGVAHRQRLGFGGSAANSALMIHRLGLPTSLLSCVGTDVWGDFSVGQLIEEGIDPTHIVRDPTQPTSLNVVAVTPDGERTMLAYRGASGQYSADALPVAALSTARHLHVSGYALLSDPQRTAAFRAAEITRAGGGTVSLDVPVDPVTAVPETLCRFMALVDTVIVGSPEAQKLTGFSDDVRAAEALAALGVSLVAIKQGADGSLLLRDGVMVQVPTHRVLVVDTTGAGDSYCAGLIAAELAGETDLAVIGRLANCCGTAAVGTTGAGANLPALADVLRVARLLSDEDQAGIERTLDVLSVPAR